MRTVTTIDTKGPFFENDPHRIFAENVRVMMTAIGEEGQADVQAQLRAGQGNRYPVSVIHGRVSDRVRGRAVAVSGKRWWYHAVISVNNIGYSKRGGMSLMAAASWLEGQYHPFRKTAFRLRRARAVNVAELTKGLE